MTSPDPNPTLHSLVPVLPDGGGAEVSPCSAPRCTRPATLDSNPEKPWCEWHLRLLLKKVMKEPLPKRPPRQAGSKQKPCDLCGAAIPIVRVVNPKDYRKLEVGDLNAYSYPVDGRLICPACWKRVTA